MDSYRKNMDLSFSIENILRDDFSQQRSSTDVASIPSQQSSFETWPCIPPVYRCCAVRYRPIFVQFLPSVHRIGAGLHRVNSEKQQLLPEQPKSVEEEDDCMSCEDHELPEGNGKHFNKK